MKFTTCSDRPLLVPCGLERFDYQLDSYIGCEHLCYYCYALRGAETDWSKEILVHRDLKKRLKEDLGELEPQQIYMGYNADPYQPCEKDLLQTRSALEEMKSLGFSASILTKSDLVLRDMDILSQMDDASVSVSVAFLNNRNRELFEDNTTETGRRIDALKTLKEAGISTGALLCPIVPHITEVLDLLEALAGNADRIWIYGLSAEMDDSEDIGWKNTWEILSTHFSGIAPQVKKVIGSKEDEFWAQLKAEIKTFNMERKLDLNIHL